MARKYRPGKSSGKGQGAILIIAAIVALIVFIFKIILFLVPFIILGFFAYKYYQWQTSRLLVYNNDWSRFYHEELKLKLYSRVSILVVIIGAIISFLRPWTGIPIAMAGLITIPKVQSLLSEKLGNMYNNWTKGTIIASLLTVSFTANGVYIDTINKEIAEKVRLEKIKNDEIVQAKKEEQVKSDSSNYFVQIASKNINDKKYDIAEDNLRKAIKLNSQNQNAIYYRGLILQNKGKYSNALEEYDKVADDSGLEAGVLQYQKGQCYMNMGKSEEALFAFQISSSLGSKKGNTLYEKHKPKPKPEFKTPKRISKSTNTTTTYHSSGNVKSKGGCLAGQCIGQTQKGNRCSRRTTNCSGRCWQH